MAEERAGGVELVAVTVRLSLYKHLTRSIVICCGKVCYCYCCCCCFLGGILSSLDRSFVCLFVLGW